MACNHDNIRAMYWQNGRPVLLDQRKLPLATEYLHLDSCAAVVTAIADRVVRGAPAIGVAAAYGWCGRARYANLRRGAAVCPLA